LNHGDDWDGRLTLLTERAREILEAQVAQTPVEVVDARIEYLKRAGLLVRADNVLAARIKAFGEPVRLQTDAEELKKGST